MTLREDTARNVFTEKLAWQLSRTGRKSRQAARFSTSKLWPPAAQSFRALSSVPSLRWEHARGSDRRLQIEVLAALLLPTTTNQGYPAGPVSCTTIAARRPWPWQFRIYTSAAIVNRQPPLNMLVQFGRIRIWNRGVIDQHEERLPRTSTSL
jgi:hypothetical protein